VRLLLLHGAGCNASVFAAQLAAIDGATAIELPGHGAPGSAASVGEFADAACAAADALQHGEIVLGGHSMGAAIALECALRRPQWLRGLLLFGGGARLRVAPAVLEGIRSDFAATVRQLAESFFFADPLPQRVVWIERIFATIGPAQVEADFRACDAFDVLDRLGEIAVPLFALTGEADKMTPPKYARTLADRVPGGRSRMIAGAGHFVMVEQPAETNAAVGAFLSEVGL
jgi:pimeloyl-ACP methyl ester carboxylesterase